MRNKEGDPAAEGWVGVAEQEGLGFVHSDSDLRGREGLFSLPKSHGVSAVAKRAGSE